ncbi:DUF3046 domain-containing protein [Corynebacterium sp. SCR221107]|uniref:DUF3046 domain-containing protein n=1 Tax=Corynebacterium sp. SCR221107 TaxID=3017361 RepID=UPI0022EC1F23|nr:DUF3046 domain-containing protein [Corynebacterium sp. SCR221107]WBT07868.1 DUF3046 domain-containing protein [Corynebacterium sp. SCR221107]
MRLSNFEQLVEDEFGTSRGAWILDSHVISGTGKTANELIESGADLREVWWGLCRDFHIPEDRQLGRDD